MKFELRHELHDGMIHVNIWGSLPIKAKSRFKGPCGNEHDVFQKQTEGLHGWTEINKGDTCMKVSSRRRQGSDYICVCKPQWGFYFYSTCNGKTSEEISSRVDIIWFIFFKKVALANVKNVYGVYIELEDSGNVLKAVQEKLVQRLLFLVIWLWTNCLTSPQCSHL